ncbi:MAG: hypothetical protein ACRDR6_23240 [Pseudonocardiaceae bacterium]
MIDGDKAEQGKEAQLPHAPASTESPADHVRSKHFTNEFLYACLVALIWTIVLFGFIAVKTSVVSAAVATLGSAVAVVTAIIGVFQPPKFPTIDPKVTRVVVATILIVDFGATVGWSGWSYYVVHRPVDVLSTVALGQNINVMPGAHATLDVAVTAQRDTILLVFQVVDHNPETGDCAPYTSLSLTPSAKGNPGVTVIASSGIPASVDLPAGATTLHMDIAVTNTRGDQNCGVDLSVVSAKLQNK